jgi:phosphoribosylanthranilate isomerase
MMVKVCGITRREDAQAAVESGASALGFVFYPPSPRYVSPTRAAELGDGLPVLKVGVFQGESAESIETVMQKAKLDVAQIYGSETPQGIRIWRAFRIVDGLGAFAGNAQEPVLLDGPVNGIPFDWSLAKSIGLNIIVAGGLDASNVASAIQAVHPWGVDASSKLESSPGIKDHSKVREFVKAALKAS